MCDRFQIVGSLLRPAELLEYKQQIEHRDDIQYPFYEDFQGYEQCEAKAIQSVVEQASENGLTILTDGEYSKSMWHLDFVWGFQGIERYIADHGYFFRDIDGTSKYETRKDIGLRITGELGGKNHHFLQAYRQLQAHAGDRETKLCVPSPSHIFGELSWSDNLGGEGAVYQNRDELKAGLVTAYKDFVGNSQPLAVRFCNSTTASGSFSRTIIRIRHLPVRKSTTRKYRVSPQSSSILTTPLLITDIAWGCSCGPITAAVIMIPGIWAAALM